ncbi:AP endonuclease [Photobacterium gaetbulicola]|uniref:Putative myo-inositol catabolism protein n=1 Tax=Photobacterium gaetbulicola Gung47 TaxID=658445 RepID=A0A0C5WKF8_9GAMM|nr:TIM barrel protein [Photobacterium gaetbulicola]AJR05609.1 putative myo-inositol catabolism protein [Photobacterium gaetbulicola Gung47]PSU14590.1 AP endonuclease [Photobacterium gaetbulicola]
MSYSIACAPCCWGVESSDNPHNPNWMTVLSEARLGGFTGTELGPYGFLPLDADTVNTALYIKELEICAGTIFEPLSEPGSYEDIISKTKRLCGLLQKIGCEKLVVIDCVNDIRSRYAGMPEQAPRLDDARWQQMMSTIRDIAEIAKRHEIRAVVHPHAGGYIEYRDEIDRMLGDLPAEEVGLCLDTGHLYYATMDPAKSLVEYADRLEYVHFKDVNQQRLQHAIDKQVGFWQACADGVMCPLGEGAVDYNEVAEALESIGYHGWITIEQERDPRHSDTTLPDIKKSRQFLVEKGFI